MITPLPPAIAQRLLHGLGARSDVRDDILGDLAEEFNYRADREGIEAARHWYYREAVRAAPHLLRDWWRGFQPRDAARLGGIVVTSYMSVAILGTVLVLVADGVMRAVGVPLIKPHLAWGNPLALLGTLVLGAIGAMLAGYFAAWLDERAPLVSAVALGAVWGAVSLITSTLASVHSPIWYRLAAPATVLIACTAGGVLRVSVVPEKTVRQAIG